MLFLAPRTASPQLKVNPLTSGDRLNITMEAEVVNVANNNEVKIKQEPVDLDDERNASVAITVNAEDAIVVKTEVRYV